MCCFNSRLFMLIALCVVIMGHIIQRYKLRSLLSMIVVYQKLHVIIVMYQFDRMHRYLFLEMQPQLLVIMMRELWRHHQTPKVRENSTSVRVLFVLLYVSHFKYPYYCVTESVSPRLLLWPPLFFCVLQHTKYGGASFCCDVKCWIMSGSEICPEHLWVLCSGSAC